MINSLENYILMMDMLVWLIRIKVNRFTNVRIMIIVIFLHENDKMKSKNHLPLVNDEIQIIIKLKNNSSVFFVKKQKNIFKV
jgi:hypothetical protein